MENENATPPSVDYAAIFNADWSRPEVAERIGTPVDALALSIISSCGRGRLLDVGCGDGALLQSLLMRGVDAIGLDVSSVVLERARRTLPERVHLGSVLDLPFEDDAFETIIAIHCLEYLAPTDVPVAIAELRRVSRRFVYLRIATSPGPLDRPPISVHGRDRWESRCLDAGLRKHPLYYRINDYEALEQDGVDIVVPLEKPNAPPSDAGVDAQLEGEDLLHRDMLGESGRRADAHCIRYHKAAAQVRPGDTVLDLACGLGYGSHILWHNSSAASIIGIDSSGAAIAHARHYYGQPGRVHFQVGDAQCLDQLDDNSVDFIASFETIEHLPHPSAYLDALYRVLKPSGRLMISAPNDWSDETGEDPNPYHFHVYTWDRLRVECGERFLLEQGAVQTAGGAQRLHHAPREWSGVDPTRELPHDAEWILLLCMKSPLGAAAVPYRETVWQLPDDPGFNVAAFARDYDNPWLVKGMVAIGMRNTSSEQLAAMRAEVLRKAAPDSVDFGAALCGDVYAATVSGCVDGERYDALMEAIRRYARIPDPSPHQLRWQISLLYAGGELAQLRGLFDQAESLYRDCAARDPIPYSPLLGTKTLDALFRLATMALSRNDQETARELLVRGMAQAKRLVSGSWLNVVGDEAHPLPFGPAELAQVLDKAARAAYLIAAIERGARPALLADEAMGFFERQLASQRLVIESLSGRVDQLSATNLALSQEVQGLSANAQSLAEEVTSQHANAVSIAEVAREQSDLAQRYAKRTVELESEINAIKRNPLRLLMRRR